jgi:hypothetical protein
VIPANVSSVSLITKKKDLKQSVRKISSQPYLTLPCSYKYGGIWGRDCRMIVEVMGDAACRCPRAFIGRGGCGGVAVRGCDGMTTDLRDGD